MKDILVPLAYIAAATVAGLFALYINRRHPYEGLKTLVEIHKDLPDGMAQKSTLAAVIATEIDRVTTDPDIDPPMLPVWAVVLTNIVIWGALATAIISAGYSVVDQLILN